MAARNNINNFISYSVTYFLIAISGLSFFFYGTAGTIAILVYCFILLCYLLITNRTSISINVKKYFAFYILGFFLIWYLQYLGCGFFPSLSFLKFSAKILLVFITLLILKERIFELYIDVIFVLGIIGLIIHGVAVAFPPFLEFCVKNIASHIPNQAPEQFQIWHNQQIIIHDFWQIDLHRNSGAFWEPGANAGFTLLALFFNMFIFRKNLFTKKNMLFIIVVLSTLSTTGFLVLSIILFANPQLNKQYLLKGISIIFIVGASAWAFLTFDFLADKLQTQMEQSNAKTAHASRFASARLDWISIEKYPLGFSIVDWRNGIKSEEDYRDCGVTILLAGVGFIGFLLYFGCSFVGFKRVLTYFNYSGNNNLAATYFIIILIVMGFSENYFERPLFLGFSLLAPFFTTKKYNIRVNIDALKGNIIGENNSNRDFAT